MMPAHGARFPAISAAAAASALKADLAGATFTGAVAVPAAILAGQALQYGQALALREVVPVSQYGILPSVGDNTAAIQSLLDNVGNAGYRVALLFNTEGVYVTDGLTVKNNTDLVGIHAGADTFNNTGYTGRTTTLQLKASSAKTALITGASTAVMNVNIRKLCLDGNKANQSAAVNGVEIAAAGVGQQPFWQIEDCHIHQFKGMGFKCGLFQRSNRLLRSNFWQNDGGGIGLYSTDNYVFQCQIGQNGLHGLDTDSENQHVICNDVFGNTQNGFNVSSATAKNFRSIGNTVQINGRHGLFCAGKYLQVIGDNYGSNSASSDGTYDDINLNSSGTMPSGVYIMASFSLITGQTNLPGWGVRAAGGQNYILFASRDGTVTTHRSGFTSVVPNFTNQSMALPDGVNLSTSTVGGSKIGTAANQKIGFYGATPIVQSTLAGVRSDGTALRNLITLLANFGLLVDSTTA